MAKKSSNACVTVAAAGRDVSDEKALVTARCVNAKPGHGWVQGEVTGYDGGFVIVRGCMISYANAYPNGKGLFGEWKCEKSSVV
jgi:hypothetical protein